ncbi:hypothetical protein GALL_426240 [mine drainage metagenome]|uniref:Uncharacterized protein n=1 Tax=mine drainage metagenome TaxID=410659 RepID=A0A1J5Q6S8_9ZZZZ
MDDDRDSVVWDIEEQVRLDQFKPLVGHRCGIDADYRAHRPLRMRERLLDRHVAELSQLASAEWAARGCDDQAQHLARRATAQGLGDRRMLGVDRHDLSRSGGLHHELAPYDERFLVRQRQRVSHLERRQRRRQPDRARDSVQDDVHLLASELLERLLAGQVGRLRRGPASFACEGSHAIAHIVQGSRVGDCDQTRLELNDLLGEHGRIAASGAESHNLERARMLAHDVGRLAADRSSGAKDDDAARAHEHHNRHSIRLCDGSSSL